MKKAVTIFGSARFNEEHKYFQLAYELSCELAKRGFSITTGGGGGIMKAANKAAFNFGQKSVGINIKLPMEQHLNEYCTECKEFNDLSLRKKELIKNKIIIVLPGGFGTLDELFEVLTLKQTNLDDFKIILYNYEFYKPLVDYFKNILLPSGAIDNRSLELFYLVDSIEELLNLID